MVLRGREFGVEIDGLLKFPQSLVAALQDRQQEADFVLEARGLGIQRSGLFVRLQSARSVTARLQGRPTSFEIRKRVRGCRQDANR